MKQKNQKGFSVIEIFIVLIVLAVLVGAGIFVKNKQSAKNSDSKNSQVSEDEINNPTKFVTHDFVDPNQIYSISKFRSAEGHDFSDGTETCRSMKHYFNQQFDAEVGEAAGRNNGIPPQPNGQTDVSIYAPTDGTISSIEAERMPIGEQIYITPDNAKSYTIRLFHVFKSEGIKAGSHITAGDKIGVISKGVSTDIAVEYDNHYISYFNVMTDEVFAVYKERGASSRDDFILSKEYRDGNPVTCNQEKTGNQQYYYPDGYDHDNDIVKLIGYIDPESQGHHETYDEKQ